MDLEEIRERVLPAEGEGEEILEMFSRIQDFIGDEFDEGAELMGSTAKGTFMRGDKDLDIFVFFEEEVPEEELEREGLKIGERVFEKFEGTYEVEYAEHPYTSGTIENFEVEIVPAYRVESGEDIRSSVDRTPFHTEWVNENLSQEEKEEVVLLKAFLRGQDLYGSTLRIEGFSGYLCELLIHEFGSFQDLVNSAPEWNEKEVIDPGNHHEVLPNYLKEKFSDELLVVIDPVDSERNVASVLSNENYSRFIFSAWRYLQEPSGEFFFPPTEVPSSDEMEESALERGDHVMVEFPTPDLIDDILYPQMRRLLKRLENLLKENDFRIFESGFHVGEENTRLLFEFYTENLPVRRKRAGPKVFHNTEHVENFTEKYDDVWVEDRRLVTIVTREHVSARALLKDFLSGDLREKGVPKNLVDSVSERRIGDIDFEEEDWRTFLRYTFKF